MKKIILALTMSMIFLSCSNQGNKFLGTWVDPSITGDNVKEITITKNGEDYLVDYVVNMNAGYGFRDGQGSFKEVAKLEGSTLNINQFVKLSLINDGEKLLMGNKEFVKKEN